MKRVTIKLDQGEYADVRQYLENNDLIILSGARGSGKSYPTAKYIGEKLLKYPDKKFIYMRMRQVELRTYNGWCQDLDLDRLANGEEWRLTRGTPKGGDITLFSGDDQRVIGQCISLEKSADFKSDKYDDFDYLVFEEYTVNNLNPEQEEWYVFNFLENVKSIFRDRPKKIIIIGNSLRTVPLLDKTIDELTGSLFLNPIKVKIFRKSLDNEKNNKYISYVNGETYRENAVFNKTRYLTMYTDSKISLFVHKIRSNEVYVRSSSDEDTEDTGLEFWMKVKRFLTTPSSTKYTYKNDAIERIFFERFDDIIDKMEERYCNEGYKYGGF